MVLFWNFYGVVGIDSFEGCDVVFRFGFGVCDDFVVGMVMFLVMVLLMRVNFFVFGCIGVIGICSWVGDWGLLGFWVLGLVGVS